MDFGIKVYPNFKFIILQLAATLFFIGIIAVFFYIVYKLIKSSNRISQLERRFNNIEQRLKRIEDKID